MALDGDDGSGQVTIHGCFSQCARVSPGQVALRHRGRSLTYAELDELSDLMAADLHARGVRPGCIVPVLLPRSPLLVASLLAIMKTGAAYAALDTSWPATHLARCLSLLPSPLTVGFQPHDARSAWTPTYSPSRRRRAPAVTVKGTDPCCVFFSSGTTGQPKGAIAPHDGTVRLFRSASFARLGPGAMMPQGAPLPWDGLTLELWSMLTTGGAALLMEPGPMSPVSLRFAVREGATLAWITASLFNLLVDEDMECFTGLGQVMVGGERLSREHVRRFIEHYPGIALMNGYGPVEATVFVTTHGITLEDCDNDLGIPIGKALPDTDLRVLDGDRPCAEGETGELCIAGPRLALGYLGGLSGGFTTYRSASGTGRLYRTGDLVMARDNIFHFIGRKDRQVKVAGHRLEPEGIERLVMDMSGVVRCAVVPVRHEDTTALALFYQAGDASVAGEEAVRAHLQKELPRYAVPLHIERLDAFPVTANGKLDEPALAARARIHVAVPSDAEPATELQARVAAVVASVGGSVSVGGVGGGRVPVDTGLLTLGLTSLDTIRIRMRLERDLGVQLAQLPRDPDVRTIASLIERARPAARRRQPNPAEPVPLSPMAASFLIEQGKYPDDTSALCPMLWDVHGDLDTAVLARAFADVSARHEALSACYRIDPAPVAVIGPGGHDAEPLLVTAQTGSLAEARSLVEAHIYGKPLRIEHGQVWRAAVASVRPGDGERPSHHVLGLAVHHVAFDGWSESVLARDLSIAYNARAEDRDPVYRTRAPRLAELAAAQAARRSADEGREESLHYWAERLRGIAGLEFVTKPTTGSAGAAGSAQAGTILRRMISARCLQRLRVLAAERKTTLFAILLAAYSECLSRYLTNPDIAIGVPIAARESSIEAETIGCLINMLTLRLHEKVGAMPAGIVARTTSELETAYVHRGITFPEVVSLIRPKRGDATPIYQAVCALQDNEPAALALRGCTAEYSRGHAPEAPAKLLVEFSPTPSGALLTELFFQPRYIRPGDADQLADDVIATLTADTTDWAN